MPGQGRDDQEAAVGHTQLFEATYQNTECSKHCQVFDVTVRATVSATPVPSLDLCSTQGFQGARF